MVIAFCYVYSTVYDVVARTYYIRHSFPLPRKSVRLPTYTVSSPYVTYVTYVTYAATTTRLLLSRLMPIQKKSPSPSTVHVVRLFDSLIGEPVYTLDIRFVYTFFTKDLSQECTLLKM